AHRAGPSARRRAVGPARSRRPARAGPWPARPPLRLGGRLALGGAALEALDAAAGVNELLAPGVERMAVRADLDVQLGLGRARGELVAAGAADVRLDVFEMDLGLHGFDSSWADQGWRPARQRALVP